MLAVLFLAVSCHIPNGRQASDEDLIMLLDKSKQYLQGSPFHPDSGLMILHALLPQQQGEDQTSNRGKILNFIGVAYDMKGMYDSAAYYLYEASRLAEKLQYDSLQMSVFSNLGILQFDLQNADEAIQY